MARSTPTRRGSRCVPPAPGRRPTSDFRQADRGAFVVGQHAVVRGQRELAAAAERKSCDRRSDRLAAGLERPKREAHAEEMIIGGAKAAWLRRRHDHIIGGPDLRQIRARAEGRRLA